MNRRTRRAAGQRCSRGDVEQLVVCPDCNADVVVTEVAPGVFQGDVYHDESCPWLVSFQRDGGLGVRFVKDQT